MVEKGYVCYAAISDGEIVYIGEGARGREKHCISGISHVHGLNALVHKNKDVNVQYLGEFDTKEEAFKYEQEMIVKYKPKFNLDLITHKKGQRFAEIKRAMNKKFKLDDTIVGFLLSHSVEELLAGVYTRKWKRIMINSDMKKGLKLKLLFEADPHSLRCARLNNFAVQLLSEENITINKIIAKLDAEYDELR